MILASLNPKGGVGKTTVAVNLAAALAERGERVVLVDLDDQYYATRAAGVPSTDALYESILGRAPLEVESSSLGFDVGPGCPALSRLPKEIDANLSLRARPFHLLEDALQPLRDKYSFIIVDCPGDLDHVTINAAFAADAVLLVLKTAYFSYTSFEHTFNRLQELAKARRRPLPIRALLSMFQRTKKVHCQVVEMMREDLEADQLFETIIPFSVRLEEAAAHDQSILQYATNSSGALAFRELAEEVRQWVE